MEQDMRKKAKRPRTNTLVEDLMDIANRHTETMRGMTEEAAYAHVKSVIAGHDIAFGIWQDANEPNGVGILVIKGEDLLQVCMDGGRSITGSISAVPCVERDQAVAAKEAMGENVLKTMH